VRIQVQFLVRCYQNLRFAYCCALRIGGSHLVSVLSEKLGGKRRTIAGRKESPENLRIALVENVGPESPDFTRTKSHIWNKAYCTVCQKKIHLDQFAVHVMIC
jgi:hypothetical protein